MRKAGLYGKPLEVIDWKEEKAKELLENVLKEMLEDNTLEVRINNIVSQEFIDLYDVEEPTDFNGWQCDWWSYMYYEGTRINVMGGAFYGTIDLSIEE